MEINRKVGAQNFNISNFGFADGFCTTEHLVGPFELKIRPMILKSGGLSQDVHASLYFLASMQNRPKLKFKISKNKI